ncbi:uncharacterized protein VTP21DRAFT_10176 [Calcarisporiella thermophila]|uniref:uncharacterized protein n=1 Tax=Calcarisporiella thermophila TaxID=911321 RepID=UPI0037434262
MRNLLEHPPLPRQIEFPLHNSSSIQTLFSVRHFDSGEATHGPRGKTFPDPLLALPCPALPARPPEPRPARKGAPAAAPVGSSAPLPLGIGEGGSPFRAAFRKKEGPPALVSQILAQPVIRWLIGGVAQAQSGRRIGPHRFDCRLPMASAAATATLAFRRRLTAAASPSQAALVAILSLVGSVEFSREDRFPDTLVGVQTPASQEQEIFILRGMTLNCFIIMKVPASSPSALTRNQAAIQIERNCKLKHGCPRESLWRLRGAV